MINTHTLSNGLRIAVDEMPEIKTASIIVRVDAGTRHEKEEENGIAHFLEHMAFKGTKTRTALEIAEKIENIGGYLNAGTGYEETDYMVKVLSEHLEIGLDVLSDIILNSTFHDKEIEVERGVILQEIAMYLDIPDDVVSDLLRNISYPDHPLGRSILGSANNIKKFKRKDFFGFVQKYYHPKQIIITVAGGVKSSDVFRSIEEKFGYLDGPDFLSPSEAKFKGGENRIEKQLEQAHFIFALEAPTITDPKVYDARVFSAILGGGMSSRLWQEIREKRGLCYSINSGVESYPDTGQIVIYSGTGSEKISELSYVVVEEIKKLTSNVQDAEVSRAKTRMKAGMLMSLEDPFLRCARMAGLLTTWGRILDLEEIIEKIENVNVQKVKDFGSTLLNSKKGSLALYGPVDEAPDLSKILSVLNH